MLKSEFQAHYADELRAAMAKSPTKYPADLDADSTAAKMVAAIEAGTFNHTDAPALKSLAKRFNIPYNRAGIQEWYAANVSDKPVPVVPPVKPTIGVTEATDLEKHFGSTGFVVSEKDAYFGTIGEAKDGTVHVTNASDLTGDRGLELRVPISMLWAIVDGPVRTPTMDDKAALRQFHSAD